MFERFRKEKQVQESVPVPISPVRFIEKVSEDDPIYQAMNRYQNLAGDQTESSPELGLLEDTIMGKIDDLGYSLSEEELFDFVGEVLQIRKEDRENSPMIAESDNVERINRGER